MAFQPQLEVDNNNNKILPLPQLQHNQYWNEFDSNWQRDEGTALVRNAYFH